ncbi:MAG TPA: hypothetical protein VGM84_27750 [Steroidobacteraceae bacterium]|jgi:hypothetical protein
MSEPVNRRIFLGRLTLTAGALVALPAGSFALTVQGAAPVAPPSGVTAASGLTGQGHVDDMWGHWPPYNHPIPYPPVRSEPAWENVEPIDRQFVS